MKRDIKTIMKELRNKNLTVVRVTKTEFELDNGDIYPHTFELDGDISTKEFQVLLDDSKSTMINHLNKIIKDNE